MALRALLIIILFSTAGNLNAARCYQNIAGVQLNEQRVQVLKWLTYLARAMSAYQILPRVVDPQADIELWRGFFKLLPWVSLFGASIWVDIQWLEEGPNPIPTIKRDSVELLSWLYTFESCFWALFD
ncbi:MAG: hypothetical protein JKY15_06885 [Deltaproteobacteria bacterium]|nr:hypothetical protein [Deltaproteobacteria bacterium]